LDRDAQVRAPRTTHCPGFFSSCQVGSGFVSALPVWMLPWLSRHIRSWPDVTL